MNSHFLDENKENNRHDKAEIVPWILEPVEKSVLEETTPEKGARRELLKDEDSFSDPVYRDISRKNGFFNKQDLSTLKRICKVMLKILKEIFASYQHVYFFARGF